LPAPHAERVLDGEQRLRMLEAAPARAEPEVPRGLRIVHFDGLSQRDIADRLRISVSMVEK